MDTPELWQFTSSHFNEKARWALDYKRVPHIRHSLVPGFHVPIVKRMTGKTNVPVLKLDGKTISDSSRIIEALERAYPEAPLYPADPDERRRALELEEYFDEELGPYIRRWIFHVILPYPEFVRALFVSHASAAAQLAHRAMSPLIGVIMRRQMNINPASAEAARGKTLAAWIGLRAICGRQVTWWASASRSPTLRRLHCCRRWSDRRSFHTRRRFRFQSLSRKSGSLLRRIPRSDGLFRPIGSIAANQRKSQLTQVSLGSRWMRAGLRPSGGSRSSRDPETAAARDRLATRRRRSAAETRSAILEAAELRFLSGGPEAIRLQEIAADAGISHPAILHHFGSREGLVEAMVSRGIARLQAQFLEGWPSAKEPTSRAFSNASTRLLHTGGWRACWPG